MDIQLQDSIQVVIRIRPNSSGSFLNYTPTSLLLGKTCFSFDRIFLPQATQDQVFSSTGAKQVQHTLEGYNSCVFVYGQTGSGKTHTMIGGGCGIIQQSLSQVFNRIQEDTEGDYTVTCSYFQIYNEQLFDLMDTVKDKKLSVRQDMKRGVFVEGLTQEVIGGKERGVELLNRGVRVRHVGETLMNRESSRSHAIFSLYIQSRRVQNGNSVLKNSKIHFVDLAGSQRQRSTAAIGQRLKEASNINKSLTTLGMVINCLSGDKTKSHVPFRDSKLTFVLRDSLSGNSKTFLIATVADSQDSLQETLSTLKFAQRAKMVKLKACINQESLSLNVQVLKSEIRRLKDELVRTNYLLNQQKKKKSGTANYQQAVVSSYTNSLEQLNQKISNLSTLIPELLQKHLPTPQEANLNSYLQNNNSMLSKMSQNLDKFICLKNEVRSKASLQKLRMEDISTPYRLTPRPDIMKQVEAALAGSFQPQFSSLRQLIMDAPKEDLARLQRQRDDMSLKLKFYIDQQQFTKSQFQKILDQKQTQNRLFSQRINSSQNRTFQLEQANTNLNLELQMVKEQLRNSQQLTNHGDRLKNEFESKLISSGVHIQTLNSQITGLQGTLSSSARKYQKQTQEYKMSVCCLEEQLVLQGERLTQQLKVLDVTLKACQEDRRSIEEECSRQMMRVQQEMQNNNQLEAKNMQLQSLALQQQNTVSGLHLTVAQKQQQSAELQLYYQTALSSISTQVLQLNAEIEFSRSSASRLSITNQEQTDTIRQNQTALANYRREVFSLAELLKDANQVSQDLGRELETLKASSSQREVQPVNSEKLKGRINELILENYKLKSQERNEVQQVQSLQMSSKLDYYQEKFALMRMEYNKSLETIRVLKQREMLIKQQNQKLEDTINGLEIELELRVQRVQEENLRCRKEGKENDRKENDRKQKSAPGVKSIQVSQSIQSVKAMILKLDGQVVQDKKDQTLQHLLKCLEEIVRRRQSKFKRETQKQGRTKSQNHLVLKENIYLKERIRILQEGNEFPNNLAKKVKIG